MTWTLDHEGLLTISGRGSMATYYNSASGGYSPWYGNRSSINKIIVLDGVTSIGDNAFAGCENLSSITIPSSITYIQNFAFWCCASLNSITIPDSVTSIGHQAFSGCSSLTSINIPNSVKVIKYGAFSGCSGLTSATISNSVTTIDSSVFEGCRSLTSVTIPNSVTTIGSSVFSGCSSLTSVTIPDSVKVIGKNAFKDCISLMSVTLSANVTSIGEWAFSGCSKLSGIILPDSVTSIGSDAFSGCSSLTSIAIPDRITNIDGGMFFGCSNLSSVTIPDGVKSIGGSAFSACTSLSSIAIPNSVEEIGWYAFGDCSSLSSITIPTNMTYITDGMFFNCSNLTSITMPISLTSVGRSAFDNCDRLVTVDYSGSRAQWNSISIDYRYIHGIEPAWHDFCTGNDALKRARIRYIDDYATLTGTITGHQGVAYKSVIAKLVGLDGKEYPVTVEGGELLDGSAKKECTYSVSAFSGQYSLEVEATTRQGDKIYRSAVVKLNGNGQTKNINLPNGQAKVNVNKNNGTKAVVGGLEDLMINSNGDLLEGTSAEVTMTIDKVSNSKPEAIAIQAEASGQTLDFFDFSIEKKVNGASASQITDTGDVTVEIILPFNSSGKKNVKVYRYHDNQVDTLTEQDANGEKIEISDDSITIRAKKFSVYAVGYTVANNENIPSSPSSGSNSDSDGGNASSFGSDSDSGSGSSFGLGTVKKEPVKGDIPAINVSKKPAASKQQPQQIVKNESVAQNTKADDGDVVNDTGQIDPADLEGVTEAVEPKESPTPSEAVIQPDRGMFTWGIVAVCVLAVGAFAGVYIRKRRSDNDR